MKLRDSPVSHWPSFPRCRRFAGRGAGSGQIEFPRGCSNGHYSRKSLDEKVGGALLKNYLEAMDYNRVYFTKKDVDGLIAKYGGTIDNDILLGNPDPAFKIFKLYKQRVEERIAKAKDLLKQPYEFASDKMIEVNRQKAAWPKDDAETDGLWRDRVEGELLQERLNKHEKDPVARITKRRPDAAQPARADNEDIIKGFPPRWRRPTTRT